jgi:hypothetical protein
VPRCQEIPSRFAVTLCRIAVSCISRLLSCQEMLNVRQRGHLHGDYRMTFVALAARCASASRDPPRRLDNRRCRCRTICSPYLRLRHPVRPKEREGGRYVRGECVAQDKLCRKKLNSMVRLECRRMQNDNIRPAERISIQRYSPRFVYD